MNSIYYYETEIGRIQIAENGSAVTSLSLKKDYDFDLYEFRETDLLKEAYKQLSQYFEGRRTSFDIPLYFEGTEFQKAVWNSLLKIPFGKTICYRELAEMTGHPKACRAVGNANGLNPIMIFVPCHRVIGADGSLGGFSAGVDIKKYLLNIENCTYKEALRKKL